MIIALQLFKLAEIAAVVILICGCCPGGALSNILALALQGDMNLRYTNRKYLATKLLMHLGFFLNDQTHKDINP